MPFLSHPITYPADLPAIAELSARSEVIDQLDFASSTATLSSLFLQLGDHLPHNTRLWYSEMGHLIGFAVLQVSHSETQIDGLLWLRFAPEARNEQLFGHMLAWGADRLQTIAEEHNKLTCLSSGTNVNDHWRLQQLQQHGFTPIRYFWRMERDLSLPIAPVTLPTGYLLRPIDLYEAAAWTELYNQSFIDHWGHRPIRVERVRQVWAEPLYRNDLNLVIETPNNVLAAFCACEYNPTDSEQIGYIDVLGTRRDYRGRGLGKAVLFAGLQRLHDSGARVVHLIVDAENPTGATRLYESTGFVVTQRSVRMMRAPGGATPRT